MSFANSRLNQLHQVNGKMLNQTKHLLTTDGTSYILCTLAPGKGKIEIPRVKGPHLLIWWKIVCSLCGMGRGLGSFWGVVAPGYLRYSDGVSCSTSSQILGNWYFPGFLLRDGSFTCMNMASLMVLVMSCHIPPCPWWWNTLHQLGVLRSCCASKWGWGSEVFP